MIDEEIGESIWDTVHTSGEVGGFTVAVIVDRDAPDSFALVANTVDAGTHYVGEPFYGEAARERAVMAADELLMLLRAAHGAWAGHAA